MSTEENKQIARAFYESFEDPEADLLAALTDDITWTLPGNHVLAGSFRGKEDLVERFVMPIMVVIESMKFYIDNIIAEGELVVVEGRGEYPMKKGGSYNNSFAPYLQFATEKSQPFASMPIRN